MNTYLADAVVARKKRGCVAPVFYLRLKKAKIVSYRTFHEYSLPKDLEACNMQQQQFQHLFVQQPSTLRTNRDWTSNGQNLRTSSYTKATHQPPAKDLDLTVSHTPGTGYYSYSF